MIARVYSPRTGCNYLCNKIYYNVIVSLPDLQAAKKNDRDILFFFLGAIVYMFGFILAYWLPITKAQLVQALALVPVLYFGVKLAAIQTNEPYLKIMFTLFMISNAIIILRIDGFNYGKIKDYLFSDFRFWPYLVPFTAFFVNKPFFFGRLFKMIFWFGLFFIFLSVISWKGYIATTAIAELSIGIFACASGLILLTWPYHNLSKKIVATAALLLALYVSAVLARRNIILTTAGFIIFSYLSYFFFMRDKATKKFLSLYAVAIIMIGGISFFAGRKNSSFKLLAGRAKDDTREYVFDQYFLSMENSMWMGKGIDGTYYCPLVTEYIDIDPVEYRDLIECGYLQVMLKGGAVNLFFLLAILVPAVILGVFFSNNFFSKGCGMLIFLWLVDMGPYGLPAFSLRYILVWICVGVCYDKRIRSMGEASIRKFIALPVPNN